MKRHFHQIRLALAVDKIMKKTVAVSSTLMPLKEPVPPKPASQDFATINQMVQDELKQTEIAGADTMVSSSRAITFFGIDEGIDDWIDQTLAAKGYIQAQEDLEDCANWCRCSQVQQVDEKLDFTSTSKQDAGLAGKIVEVFGWASFTSFVVRGTWSNKGDTW